MSENRQKEDRPITNRRKIVISDLLHLRFTNYFIEKARKSLEENQ